MKNIFYHFLQFLSKINFVRFTLLFSCLYAIDSNAQEKVGVNTATPITELDVRTTTDANGADINIGNASNSHFLRLFSGKDAATFTNPTIYWNENDSLLFGKFGLGFTEFARFSPNGNFSLQEGWLGIGTPKPFTELHISDKVGWSRITNESQLNGDAIIQLTDNASNGPDSHWTIRRDGSDGGKLQWRHHDIKRMTLNTNGKLGLGTTDPLGSIHIKGTSWTPFTIEASTNDPYLQLTNGINANSSNSDWTIRLDASDSEKLQWRYNNLARMTVKTSGFTGIGTADPLSELHIKDSGFSFVTVESGAGQDAVISFTDNTTSSIAEHWTIRRDGSDAGSFKWRHGDNVRMSLSTDGRLAIGNIPPAAGYKLNVDGRIIVEEMRIQLSQNWPDYVFQEDYNLMPIEELDVSIKKNGHLPGIPSAKIIENDGFDSGEMHRLMMEKIEELTLYIIELKKENEVIKASIENLKRNDK